MSLQDRQDDQSLANRLASASIELFNTLPRHGKPTVRPNGVHEWTVLATISLVISTSTVTAKSKSTVPIGITSDIVEDAHPSPNRITEWSSPPSSPSSNGSSERCSICFPDDRSRPLSRIPSDYNMSGDVLIRKVLPISLGTGMKVLPATRLSRQGDTLHDSHAEIIARRGFIRWLMDECGKIVKGEEGQGVLKRVDGRFRLKEGVEVWMYISTLPCGDASTLYTALHQPSDMAALKNLETGSLPASPPGSAVRGRNGYENYGAIRTKPGRSDSIPAISFSCSDKIASWNILGLQGALLSAVMDPVYLGGVVIGGVEDEGDLREKMRGELDRALWGRLSGLQGQVIQPYRLNRPQVKFTDEVFPYSKTSIVAVAPSEPTSSPHSSSLIPLVSFVPEMLHQGFKQGGKWRPDTGLAKSLSRSRLCKLEMMREFIRLLEAIEAAGDDHVAKPTNDVTYHQLKHSPGSVYQKVKTLLRGELQPARCLSGFERCGDLETTGVSIPSDAQSEPPFKGWIVSGERWESFTASG